jgi:hypothetical protein
MGVIKRITVEVNADTDGETIAELIGLVRGWCRESSSADYRVEDVIPSDDIKPGDMITIVYGPVKVFKVFQLRFDTVVRLDDVGNFDLRTGDGAQIARVQR